MSLTSAFQFHHSGFDPSCQRAHEQEEVDAASSGPSIQMDFQSLGKRFVVEWSRKNRRAFERCWKKVDEIASEKIKELYDEKFGELCEYMKVFDADAMRVTVLYAGFNIADSSVSCKFMSNRIRSDCTPYVAVLEPRLCTNMKTCVESLATQLIDIEKNIISSSSKKSPEYVNEYRRQSLRSSKIPGNEKLFELKETSKRKRKYNMIDVENFLDKENQKVSIIVVIEDAENIDSTVLCQLMAILLHYHRNRNLNIGVAVGLRSCNSHGIHGMLNRSITARLKIRTFKAKDSLAIMEALFKELLIYGKMPLRLGSTTIKWLSDQFLSKEQSIQGFLRALKLASIKHFASHPGAFVCCQDESEEEIFSQVEIASMMELPSVQKLGSMPKDFDSREIKVVDWIKRLSSHREYWGPYIFQCVYLARMHLQNMEKNHPRATYVDITSESLQRIRDRIQYSETLEPLEKFINECNTRLQGGLQLGKLCLEFKQEIRKDTESPSVAAVSSPSIQLSQNSRLNAKKKRDTFRESLMVKKPVCRARLMVLHWWDSKVMKKWDGSTFPLGELFFYNDAKFLRKAFAAQPRAAVCEAMLNPINEFRDQDTCVAYQLLDSELRKPNVSLLDWYDLFLSSTEDALPNQPKRKKQQNAISNEKANQARFLRATSELKSLGLFKISARRPEYVTKLIHHLNH